MTKTYEFVTLYYKGRAPLKKEDNSYLMCLYTMLFVLFAMVIILLLCTFFNLEQTEEEPVLTYNKPQPFKKTETTQTTTTSTTPPGVQIDYYEETAAPVVDLDKVVEFFIGPEEDNELKPSQRPTNSPALKEKEGGSKQAPPVATRGPQDSSEATNVKTTNQKHQIDVKVTSKATETPTESSLHSTTKEKADQGLEIENQASTKAPKGHIFTPQPYQDLGFEIQDLSSIPKGYIPPKQPTNPSVAEENLNEWQETTNGDLPPPPPEVEWVPTQQNLTIKDKKAQFKTPDCRSDKCKVAASSMLSSVDLSVEPCSNFYSFACGRASPEENEDPDFSFEESKPELDFVEKFKVFYQSCLDHEIHLNYRDRVKVTKKVLSDIVKFDQERSTKDLTDVFGTLVLLDAMPFLNFDIDVINSTFVLKMLPPDKKLSSKYWSPLAETRKNCLRSTQPENNRSPLDITFLYYDYEKCQKNYNDYLKSVETALEEMGNFGNLSSKQIELSIEETLETIRKHLLPIIDEIQSVQDQQKTSNMEYIEINPSDLKKLYPIINWHEFFKIINLDTTKPFIQVNKEYFEILFKKLSSLDTKTLIKAFNAILTEKYYQEVVLPTPKHSRAKYCSKLTRKLFPDISNYLNQRNEVGKDFKDRKNYIHSLFQNMKEDFQNTLNGLNWLDNKSRISIKNKLDKLKLKTYTNDINNETIYLSQLYSELDLKEGDFSLNYNQVTEFRQKTYLNLHGKSVTTENIYRNFVDNLKDEPVFFYGHNIAYVPNGLVHKTFIDLPKYLTIAKIGFPLAKIIGHSFDPIGVKFDLNLSENVSSLYNKFVRESKRTLPHHLDYKKLDVVFNLNDKVSEVGRIAENTAMAILTNTIEEIQHQALLPLVSFTFSREKIFFMALAQEFCQDTSLMEFVVQAHESSVLPAQFKIQNILQNSEAFNTQFSCRPTVKLPQLQFPHLSVLIPRDMDKIT